MPFIVSPNGQIFPEPAAFICRQIEQKLVPVDGRIKQSKKYAKWKLWTRHISVAINKTASRNTLRKITKMIGACASIHCEDLFPSVTPCAEELEQHIVLLFMIERFAGVISQANKIESKIVMKEKLIVATVQANMHFNGLVSTKRRPVGSSL